MGKLTGDGGKRIDGEEERAGFSSSRRSSEQSILRDAAIVYIPNVSPTPHPNSPSQIPESSTKTKTQGKKADSHPQPPLHPHPHSFHAH